jgi:DNA-binding transcriptional LysR family regulator
MAGVDTMLLAVFQEVARQGSFTAAARSLGYTQSAVSRQISALEQEIGAGLFDRQPRGVRLTDEGRCLLPHAEAVTGRLGSALDDLRALRDLSAGRLRLGAFATADAALLPEALAAFRRAHPKVAVSLAEGYVREHVAQLHSGDLDLAIVTSTAPGVLDGLRLHHLLDDTLFVAMHRDHPLAGRPGLRLSELSAEDWIAGSSRPEETLIRAAVQSGFRPRITYVVGGWTAKQGFVAAGLGITLIPSLAAGAVRPDLALAPLDPADCPSRRIYAATPLGQADSPATAAFLGFLQDSARRLRR